MIVRPGDTAFIGVDSSFTNEDMDAFIGALKACTGSNTEVVIVRGLRTGFIVRNDEVG